MSTQLKKMDVIANNIANVNTTGYKKDSIATQSFSEELMKRLNDPGPMPIPFRYAVPIGKVTSGVFLDTVFTNFASGSLVETGNALDLAMHGNGFFTVSVSDAFGRQAEMYTRDGDFALLSGRLVTSDGSQVIGNNGPITIPEGDISIDEFGNIFSNGEFIDTLRIVDFEDRSTLRSAKNNKFETTVDSVFTAPEGRVRQGSLEGSNVVPAREMIELISINRTYEASQRAIMTIDTTLNRAVNDIGSR
jgi:flagellar basal-body rod protein FlgG